MSAQADQSPAGGSHEDLAMTKRVRYRNRRFQQHREDRQFWNGELKHKSLWSYDWSIPLAELEQHHDLKRPRTPKNDKPNGDTSRPRWDRPRGSIHQSHADQIYQPCIWSVLRFKSYVEDLARSWVGRWTHRKIYGKEKSHTTTVADILIRLFHDPGLTQFLSIEACNIGLKFFYRHALVPQARALYDRMEHLHMEIGQETSNTILQGSAAQNDLHNYTFHLKGLIERGFHPDARAWVALLMAVNSKEARATIVRKMHHRGLLEETQITKDVVALMVRDELAAHFGDNKDMGFFYQHMDIRYGSDWLSITAANNILDEVGIRSSVQEVFKHLDILKKRIRKFNQATLTIVLAHCLRLKAHTLAVDAVDIFKVGYGIGPNDVGYGLLFNQAWRSRMYNFARVVWRAACMQDAVTFEMRTLVMDSLWRRYHPDKPRSRKDIFETAIGKVVVAVDPLINLNKKNHSNREPSGLQMSIYTLLQILIANEIPSTKAEAAQSKAQIVRHSTTVLENDLEAFQRYRLRDNLADVLRKALATDQRWAEQNCKMESTLWKRQHAIQVKVVDTGRSTEDGDWHRVSQ